MASIAITSTMWRIQELIHNFRSRFVSISIEHFDFFSSRRYSKINWITTFSFARHLFLAYQQTSKCQLYFLVSWGADEITSSETINVLIRIVLMKTFVDTHTHTHGDFIHFILANGSVIYSPPPIPQRRNTLSHQLTLLMLTDIRNEWMEQKPALFKQNGFEKIALKS